MEAGRIAEQTPLRVREGFEFTPVLKRRMELYKANAYSAATHSLDLSALTDKDPKTLSTRPRIWVEKLPNGLELEIPRMSEADEAHLAHMSARLGEDNMAQLLAATQMIAAAAFEAVAQEDEDAPKVMMSSAGVREASQNARDILLNRNRSNGGTPSSGEPGVIGNTGTGGSNIPQEQEMIIAGAAGAEQELREIFQDFNRRAALSEAARAEAVELREMLADWPEGETETFTYNEVTKDENGNFTTREVTVELDREQATALLSRLEANEQMLSIGTTESMKLQMVVHKYREAVDLVSNSLKLMDDTLKNTIQALKG